LHAGDANETSHRVTRTGNGDRIPVTVRACRNCSLATPDLGKKRFARARQRVLSSYEDKLVRPAHRVQRSVVSNESLQ